MALSAIDGSSLNLLPSTAHAPLNVGRHPVTMATKHVPSLPNPYLRRPSSIHPDSCGDTSQLAASLIHPQLCHFLSIVTFLRQPVEFIVLKDVLL